MRNKKKKDFSSIKENYNRNAVVIIHVRLKIYLFYNSNRFKSN